MAVCLLVYRSLQAKRRSLEAGVDVMVAANDLQVGAGEQHDIKIIRFLPGICHGLPQKERRRRTRCHRPHLQGRIHSSQPAGENAGSGLPSLIPPGMRAVSVRVNEIVSVAGFVTPGTRVDVLLTGTPNGDQQTTTVLQNVAVLASGHTLERTPPVRLRIRR